MRVLLISANTEQINIPVFPFGLACVARAVQNAGHEVEFINLMNDTDRQLYLEKGIKTFEPHVIGISVRNIDDQSMQNTKFLLQPVREVVNDCRAFSDAPIVLGGAGYSIFPESALAYLGADMGIQGEGEKAFPDLLERLEKKKDLRKLPGLHLIRKGIHNQPGFINKLDVHSIPLENK